MKRIDTHFHPNFLFRLPKPFWVIRQAKNIRNGFKKHDLDAVIITEHVFKNPALSYKILLEQKPADAKTLLIPWVEASTIEWIDMIVFSKDTYVYTCEPIMTTKHLSFDEMIEYVNNDDRLYGVVTHPFSPSQTAVTKHYPIEKVLEATKKLWYIEKHNASFIGIKRRLESWSLSSLSLVKKFLDQIALLDDVPSEHYEKDSILLWGSDAHHPDDLWDYTLFTGSNDNKSPWELLTSHTASREFHIHDEKVNVYWFMIRNFFIIARERLINVFKLYYTDTTYFPSSKKQSNLSSNDHPSFLRLKKILWWTESF